MIVLILFCGTKILLSQTPEDEASKKLVSLETEAFYKCDSTTWKSLYVQDRKTNKTYVQNGYCSSVTIDTLSCTSTRPEYIEDLFNATGYSFLRDKKLKEAIGVFKFNVKMHTKASSTYDSLGEGYAAMRDKKLAKESYEIQSNSTRKIQWP